jgi:hypothetical protein
VIAVARGENSIVYFKGSTHLLPLRSFRIRCGHIMIQRKVTRCTW